MRTVLIIDDDENFRDVVREVLQAEEYDVYQAGTVHDAFGVLNTESIDVILCDLNLPFKGGDDQVNFEYSCKTGIETIKELRGVYPDKPIIALTGLASIDLNKIMSRLACTMACTKPASSIGLVEIVRTALDVDQGSMLFH